MKKLAILLSILLIASLCGCAGEKPCEHQWTDADCLNPKACTLCGVTEGDALGHDFMAATCDSAEICTRCAVQQGEPLAHEWQSATCSSPETCALCGSTQGEALPHSFGKWEIAGEEMTRACSECGAAETAPLDREVYALDQVIGHWDPYMVSDGENTYWATILRQDSPVYCIHIGDDGQIRLEAEEDVLEGTLIFTEYIAENAEYAAQYTLEADFGEDRVLSFIFYELDDGDGLVTVLNKMVVYFSQHEFLSGYVQGTWATADGGSIRTLTLLEDGTFDYNGEFSGNWHIRYKNSDNTHYCTILLHHFRDGEPVTDLFNVSLSISGNDPLEALLYYPYAPLGDVYMDDDYLHLSKMEPEEIAQLEATIAEGQGKLLGTWCSQTVSKYNYNDTKNAERIDMSYSITFREDGTFTARLDSERVGTWKFWEVRGGVQGITYWYDLTYDNAPEVSYLSAYLSNDNVLRLSENYDGYTVSYVFRMPEDTTPEDAAEMLCGDWASYSAYTYFQATGEREEWSETGYSLTFHEDGTVSAFMEGAKEGVWVYMSKETYDYGSGQTETRYDFVVQFDGDDSSFSAAVYAENSLGLSSYDGETSTTWHFSKSDG